MNEIRMLLKDYLNLIKKPAGRGYRRNRARRYEFENEMGVSVSLLVQKVQAGDFTIYRKSMGNDKG